MRGQYVAGVVEGTPREGYAEEVGKTSKTETFVAMKVDIDNWRWAGVPFFLRTGKNLPDRRTQIVVQFKPVPHNIFGAAAQAETKANRLVIDLQPDEDISLTVMTKRPGLSEEGMRLQSLPLSLAMSAAGSRRRIAYEKLLLDVFRGDRTCSCGATRSSRPGSSWTACRPPGPRPRSSPRPTPRGTWGRTAPRR